MAKYRNLTSADQQQIAKLRKIDADCKPLKEQFLALRDQHLKLSADQDKIVQQLHSLGNARQALREELLSSGLDPKVLTQLEHAQ